MIALLVLGLAVGATGYVATDRIAGEVEQQVQSDSVELAEQEARNVEKWHELNTLRIEAIGAQVLAEEGEFNKREYIGSEARGDDVHDIHHVDIVDDEILHSTNSELHGQALDSTEQAWALRLLEGGDDPLATEYRYLRGEPAVVAHEADDGTPVLSYMLMTDEPNQVVVRSMVLDEYSHEMIDDGGRISYIVNAETGQVVMDPRGSAFFEEYDADSMDFADVSTDAGIYEIGTPGQALASSVGPEYREAEYLASAVRVTDGSEWLVVIHTPEDEAYGFVHNVREYGAYASIGGILFVVLVGGVVGHNTSRSIDRLRRKAERMEEGDLDVELETERIDSIGRLYAGFETMRDSLEDQIEEAQTAREETERVNRHLEAKADEYRDVMRICARGDLTARMDPDEENEAMREIAEEFNEMVSEIERTTAQLKAFADDVATASEQVTASSEEVRSASEQVTESIQEISDGAQHQNESLRSVNHEMNGLSTTIEEIASSSNEVADVAERTAETGERGREAAEEAIEGMNAIEAKSETAVEEIERLESEMEQIDELLAFITEVAEQTNMLALNANIEAARSGSSGEGFSVVAGEVKELAEETKEAAEDIERRLERIKEQTERTASEVQTTSERISDHAASVERAVDALDEIAEYATVTNDGVQEISAASQQQAASTQQVVAMVDRAATISEETTAESENVAAAAEEQTTALTEVSQSASDLADQASHLSEALDRFETDARQAGVSDRDDADGTGSADDTPEGGPAPSEEDESDDGGDRSGPDPEANESVRSVEEDRVAAGPVDRDESREPRADDGDDDEPIPLGPRNADESESTDEEFTYDDG